MFRSGRGRRRRQAVGHAAKCAILYPQSYRLTLRFAFPEGGLRAYLFRLHTTRWLRCCLPQGPVGHHLRQESGEFLNLPTCLYAKRTNGRTLGYILIFSCNKYVSDFVSHRRMKPLLC